MAADRLVELRARVRARQRAAGNKISKMKRRSGAVLAGTELDPRKSSAAINKLNTRQLEAQLRRLDSFIDRKTQYVGLANGVVPKKKWKQLKDTERKSNEALTPLFKAADATKSPGGDWSVVDKYLVLYPNRRETYAKRINNRTGLTYSALEPGDIYSPKALDKLIKRLKQQAKPGFLEARYKKQFANFEKMAAASTIPVDVKKFRDTLTPYQFSMLWDWGGLPNSLSVFVDSPPKKKWYDKVEEAFEDREQKANEWFMSTEAGQYAKSSIDKFYDWASKLPKYPDETRWKQANRTRK